MHPHRSQWREVEFLFGFVRRLGVRRDHAHSRESVAMPKNPTQEPGSFYADNAEGRHFPYALIDGRGGGGAARFEDDELGLLDARTRREL